MGEVSLRKSQFSKMLFKTLSNKYIHGAGDSNYVVSKWQKWVNNPSFTVYRAKKANLLIGWVVYDKARSIIEELLIDDPALENKVLDVLVGWETLLAAEVLESNQSLIQRLIEYGFRPGRRYQSEGFNFILLELSTAVLLNKLGSGLTAKGPKSSAQVVVEKVPETRSDIEIKEALSRLLTKMGGIKRFVKPGQTVVIKPNIVSDHGLKDGVYIGGVVTDIRVVKAMVKILLPLAGKIIIAEGSSINRSETSKMFRHYGYEQLIEIAPDKVQLLDLNLDEQIDKPVPRGKRMSTRQIPITLDQADVFINMPVMKNHFAATVSLCIKSMQGAVPPLEKYMSHFFGLWQNLVNIHHLLKPQLWILDGLTGQEDFGPLSGTPKVMNLLIGGTNPVAIDAVTMRIMGLEPQDSPPVWLAHLQGFGPIDPDDIKVIGPPLNETRSPFSQPELDLSNGKNISINVGGACTGCRAYLHFGLSKLRRPDPLARERLLIDRPLPNPVNIFLGPETDGHIKSEDSNIFMGFCQQHHADLGLHMPGCPPHSEVILGALYSLFPDLERPNYADKNEEAKLGEMLQEILTRVEK